MRCPDRQKTLQSPRNCGGRAPSAQPLGRNVDRRLRTAGEAEDDGAARRGHAGELIEERDHVRERHEVERPVSVRSWEASASSKRHGRRAQRMSPPGAAASISGARSAPPPRSRETARDHECGPPSARSEVELLPWRAIQRLQRRLERVEGILAPHPTPHRGHAVELPPRRAAGRGARDVASARRRRSQAARTAGRVSRRQLDVDLRARSRTERLGGARLTASATFRYESSYRISSPASASANVRAVTACRGRPPTTRRTRRPGTMPASSRCERLTLSWMLPKRST